MQIAKPKIDRTISSIERKQKFIDHKKSLLYDKLYKVKYFLEKDVKPTFRKNIKRTKPELKMMEILDGMGVKYEVEFPLKLGNMLKFYDFRLIDAPVLLEVDGDWVHGNSDVVENPTLWQYENKKNDVTKNWIAKQHKYILLRFWASELELNEKKIRIIIEQEVKSVKQMDQFQNSFIA